MLREGIAVESQGSLIENQELDWSFLSIPSNLYKVHLNDNDSTVSSVDTDHEDEVFDDDFDTNSQNQDINIRKKNQSLDITGKDKVKLHTYKHTDSLFILCMHEVQFCYLQDKDKENSNKKKGFYYKWLRGCFLNKNN